ncbi:DUF2585 family protein [Sinorhizobium medicae]|uniref:DUF2585 family protein n=1 Tax=Sinorhizobium medicae TaxID=110321 RepID=UPI000FDB34EE|nr:DUF2585 family protein [Sinorhizobium medicae]RVJ83436.1 DUF2585 family protein [Sinorhizobium medicae]
MHIRNDVVSRSSRYLAISFLVICSQIIWLLSLGRNWFCTCGSLRLWAGMDPAQNSQQFFDPYSLLHFAFGCGLDLWLTAVRPHFTLARRAAYAVMSSVFWEMCENLPFVIGILGTEGTQLAYSGDSIVNSLSDAFTGLIGFAVASRISTPVTVSAMLALEVPTFTWIGDSVVAGVLRYRHRLRREMQRTPPGQLF